MEWLLNMALTPTGRIVSIITASLAAFGIWLAAHDHSIRKDEHQSTIANVNEGAKALNDKGLKARSAVAGSDSLKRLRQRYCDDCKSVR
jgi:hypothetical protein